MNVFKCEVSNLRDVFLYFRDLKDGGEMPSGMGQLPIFNTLKITLILEDIDAFVALKLKQISEEFKVLKLSDSPTYEELSESLNIPETTLDDIKDYDRFFNIIQDDEDIHSDKLYKLILEVHYNVISVMNGSTLLSLIGSRVEEIFMGEDGLMSEEEFESSQKEIEDKFVGYLVNGIYTSMNGSLNSVNEIVSKELMRMFYSKAESQTSVLCRAITPFGGDIKFISSKNEDDGLEKGIEAIKECKEYGLIGDIDIYVVCKSTFYTYLLLTLFDNFNTTCYDIKEQLRGTNLYVDDFIIEKYQKRLDTFLIPLLTWKQYVYENNEYLSFYKVLFANFNNIITYSIKIKRSDLEMFKEKIENILNSEITTQEIEMSDYKDILNSLNEILTSVSSIIK